MSDTTGWYARKMAQHRGQPAPPQQVPYQPPQQTFSYQQPPQQPPQQRPQFDTTSKQPQAGLSDLFTVQQNGGGKPGIGARLNPDPCPQCGQPFFYHDPAAADNLGKRRGPPPAPHCFTCGYNGMFQQGLAAIWEA